jgi:hypothetical protein
VYVFVYVLCVRGFAATRDALRQPRSRPRGCGPAGCSAPAVRRVGRRLRCPRDPIKFAWAARWFTSSEPSLPRRGAATGDDLSPRGCAGWPLCAPSGNGSSRKLKPRAGKAETAMAAAEEANQVQSAFLAPMSHELRTPLDHERVCRPAADGGAGSDPAAAEQQVKRIGLAARHMLQLIEEPPLHAAGGWSGSRPSGVVAVPELAQGVCAILQPLARGEGVAVRRPLGG